MKVGFGKQPAPMFAHQFTPSQMHTVQTHLDVVSGPVDAAHGHLHSAQAAFVHVAGNGAAEARQAEGPAEA